MKTNEKSCIMSHHWHSTHKNECPNCQTLGNCPKCGGTDIMKLVAPMPDMRKGENATQWIRCFACGHDTEYYDSFKDALVEWVGKRIPTQIENIIFRDV